MANIACTPHESLAQCEDTGFQPEAGPICAPVECRRESLPPLPPGARAVHYETLPDGSGLVRLSFTILVF